MVRLWRHKPGGGQKLYPQGNRQGAWGVPRRQANDTDALQGDIRHMAKMLATLTVYYEELAHDAMRLASYGLTAHFSIGRMRVTVRR